MSASGNGNGAIQKALQYAGDTKAVVIGTGTIGRIGEVFRACFGEQKARIVADPTTYRVAGRFLEERLRAEGKTEIEPAFVFESDRIHAEMRLVDILKPELARSGAIPVAVGSGTVNDLVKYTSSLFNRPYMVVGTAASMDGYTSFGASIEYNACKQTFNCPAPAAVLVDLDILQTAPLEMNASGYADLIAKVPAAADWMLADLIGTEPIDQEAFHLVQDPLRAYLADPDGIRTGKKEALSNLIEGLIMSGLAMQKARSSRTASGAEHQFSHLWDNERHTYNGRTPSHGFKVGIGTISTSALYEKALAFDRSVFDRALATLPGRFLPWEKIQEEIHRQFDDPGLVATVLRQCELKYVPLEEVRRRIALFRDRWDDFKPLLAEKLMPARTVQDMIRRSAAPATPEEIGIDRSRLHSSYAKARLLRCRYNVLDWMVELGLWRETVDSLFASGGFWYRTTGEEAR